jgi:hypothetical protein
MFKSLKSSNGENCSLFNSLQFHILFEKFWAIEGHILTGSNSNLFENIWINLKMVLCIPAWPTGQPPPCARATWTSRRCRCRATQVRGVARRASVPSTHVGRPHHITGCPYLSRSPSSFPIFHPRESFSPPLFAPSSATPASPRPPPFFFLLALPPSWLTHPHLSPNR